MPNEREQPQLAPQQWRTPGVIKWVLEPSAALDWTPLRKEPREEEKPK